MFMYMYSINHQNLFFLKGNKNNTWAYLREKICQRWHILNHWPKMLSGLFSLRMAIKNLIIPLDLEHKYQNLYLKPFRLLLTTKRPSSVEPVCLANLCSLQEESVPLNASSAFFYSDAHRCRRVFQEKKYGYINGDKLWSDCRKIRYLLWESALLLHTPFVLWLAPKNVCMLNKSIFEMRDIFM